MPIPRYAIYYTPTPESPLDRFGAGVLGYDCFEGHDVPRLPIHNIDPPILAILTVEPARYGFHATLKAPFCLGGASEQDLLTAFNAFAEIHRTVPVGPLEVACIGGFVVLRPAQPSAELEELAAACVADFDVFRAPMAQGERERRRAGGLSARQLELLERWGYPYVFNEFRFHMTLAGPVPDAQRAAIKSGLARAFEPLARDHLEVGAISLMRRDDARFRVLSRQRLKGR
jgi:putative phosphonate metabolism protein